MGSFSERPPPLTLAEGRRGVFLAASEVLSILLDTVFVILVLTGQKFSFVLANPLMTGLFFWLLGDVALVLFIRTSDFRPSLLHVTRGEFGLAILLVTICLALKEMTTFFAMRRAAGTAFLLVERAGLMWSL
jgi:hypothetical protein